MAAYKLEHGGGWEGDLIAFRTQRDGPLQVLHGDHLPAALLRPGARVSYVDDSGVRILRLAGAAPADGDEWEPRAFPLADLRGHQGGRPDRVPPGAVCLYSLPVQQAEAPAAEEAADDDVPAGRARMELARRILAGSDPDYPNGTVQLYRWKLSRAQDPEGYSRIFLEAVRGCLGSPAPNQRALSAMSIGNVIDTVGMYTGFLHHALSIPVSQVTLQGVTCDPVSLARFIQARIPTLSRSTARLCLNNLWHMLKAFGTMALRGTLGYEAGGYPFLCSAADLMDLVRSDAAGLASFRPQGARQRNRSVMNTVTDRDFEDLSDRCKVLASEPVEHMSNQAVQDLLILGFSGFLGPPPLRAGVATSLTVPCYRGACCVTGCHDDRCAGNKLLEEAGGDEGLRRFTLAVSHYKNGGAAGAGPRRISASALGSPLLKVLTAWLGRRPTGLGPLLFPLAGSTAGGNGTWAGLVQEAAARLSVGDRVPSFSSMDARFLYVRMVERRLRGAKTPPDEAERIRTRLADQMLSSVDSWRRTYARTLSSNVTGDSAVLSLIHGTSTGHADADEDGF